MQPQYPQPARPPVQPSQPQPQPSYPPSYPPPQPQPSRPAEPEVDADGGFPYDPNSRPDEVPEDADPYAESGPGRGYGDPNAIHVPTAPVVAAVPTGEKVAEVIVTVDAGADALLNCELPGGQTGGQQLSSVIWSRDGRQVALDLGKYEQSSSGNGSLIIRRTDFADHGTYACVGEIVKEGGGDGVAQQSEMGYVKLQVRGKFYRVFAFFLSALMFVRFAYAYAFLCASSSAAPVQIRPGPTKVIALSGVSSYLQCNAVGFPDPKVTWWRGDRSLPLRSFKYEQLANYTLVIRKVGGKDGGVYTCNVSAAALALFSCAFANPLNVAYFYAAGF